MNFEVLSTGGVNAGYGQYNPGPSLGQRSYDGQEFMDYHEDGTSHCAQAQAMPAVVGLRRKFDNMILADGNDTTGLKALEMGRVIREGDSAFVVTGYVENPGGQKEVYIPVAVSGTTMVDSRDIKKGNDAIAAGSVVKTKQEDKVIGRVLISEDASVSDRLVMVNIC